MQALSGASTSRGRLLTSSLSSRTRSRTPPRSRSPYRGEVDRESQGLTKPAICAALLATPLASNAPELSVREAPIHSVVQQDVTADAEANALPSPSTIGRHQQVPSANKQLPAQACDESHSSQPVPEAMVALHDLQQLRQQHSQLQQQQQLLQQLHQQQLHKAALDSNQEALTEQAAAQLQELRAELSRVQAAESAALAALNSQEEALLQLASQLKEAAHSEIVTLQATESRLLALVRQSTARLRAMYAQRMKQHVQLAEFLHCPEQLMQLVLSGGYVMYAGGAVATAAAVFAAGKLGASKNAAAAAAAGSPAGRASAGGNAGGTGSGSPAGAAGGAGGAGGTGGAGGGPVGRMQGRGPVVAATAVQGALARPTQPASVKDDLDTASNSSSISARGNSKWRSLLGPPDNSTPVLPTVAELPAHLSKLLASNEDGMLSALHTKAAEAAAATQVLHALQQQEAHVTVKSAELAASSLAAEKRLAEAVESEVHAAEQLLQAQHASHPAQGSKVIISRRGSSKSQALRLASIAMQEQLARAKQQLHEAVAARTAAQNELQKVRQALVQEQNQSAAIAQQLEATQAQLSTVSTELCSMQALLQQQHREQYQSHRAAATTGTQQPFLDESQVQQLHELQLAEQRLSAELSEAQQHLASTLQLLHAERTSCSLLHQQVSSLQHKFADARAEIDAERQKAAALQDERNRLKAALQQASRAAASAQADAAAARQQVQESAQKAQAAAAEVEGAHARLAEAKGHNRELGHRLHVAVEVVAQQQAILEQRGTEVVQLQQEVVHTRRALSVEREQKQSLKAVTASLQQRIVNMAATREAGNKHLSSQIDKLRQQLNKSKEMQHESQVQVATLKQSFSTARQHLAREQAASRTFKETAAELQQRLANLRATSSRSSTAAAAAVASAQQQSQLAAQQAAQATGQLKQATAEVQQLKCQLAVEAASKAKLKATAEELQQRLANLRATSDKHAAATEAAAAAVAAARHQQNQLVGTLHSPSGTSSTEVARLQQEHQQELQELHEQLIVAVAAAEDAGQAALQQQQEQLAELQQQLTASTAQAEAAQAAEAAAQTQLATLQQLLQQQHEAVRSQAEALDAAKAETARLKERFAHNRAQLESEKEKALSHEATAEQLKQRLASLHELKAKEQLQHSKTIKMLLAEIEDAQAKVVEVSEVRTKAERKYITARDEMNRHQQQLTVVHKHQQDLEARLRNMKAIGSVPRPVAAQLQQQLDKSSTELELAERHLRDLERHYFAARNELAESQHRAEDLEKEVGKLQAELAAATEVAQRAADAAAEEQLRLQEQLQQQQQQLDNDRLVLESLQRQAVSTKEELNVQHKAAAGLQQQVAALQARLATTESEKAEAEQHAADLAEQLAAAQDEMHVLQTAHAETEQVAAQVAADLAAAREWAYANAARFSEMQRQLGEYRADLQDTQENLKLTHEKLQAAEAQQAVMDEQLAETKEQLAAEQAAHGSTHQQLAAARAALDRIKAQYVSTRDQLEAERARSLQLERTVAGLRERLQSLQQLREQQHEASAAERAKWLEQVAAGQKQQEQAKAALATLQQEYFSAYERLETEQQRVGTLESIVGLLEERMAELSAAAMSAPAASALELGGGPAAELVVASNALRKEWKTAQSALSTCRHMLATLEQEYNDARAAVDAEHQCYAQVEASLEFLQERLEAAERAGAGEEERYQHTTAELHEQLEQQASELVECQHRIANLKEELEASRQRLEDEQHNEAQLALRAQQLDEEAAAAGWQLQQAGVDASGFPAVEVAVPASDEASTSLSTEVVGSEQLSAASAPGAASADGLQAAEPSRVSRWAALLSSVDQEVPAALSKMPSNVPALKVQQPVSAQDKADAAAGAAARDMESSYEPMDMSAVRKHVEEMAAQYVEKLTIAEAELQAVRSVWQQADDELAAIRSSPRGSSDGSRATSPRTTSPRGSEAACDTPGSPRLLTPTGRVGPDDFELMRVPPVSAPKVVSGSQHVGAEEEHGIGERIAFVMELPSPQFGGGHVGNFPAGFRRSGADTDNSVGAHQGHSSSSGSLAGLVSRPSKAVPVVAAAGVNSSGMHGPQVLPAAAGNHEADRAATLLHAVEQGVQSNSGNTHVHVRMTNGPSAAAPGESS